MKDLKLFVLICVISSVAFGSDRKPEKIEDGDESGSSVEFIHVPIYGTTENLKGRVSGVEKDKYAVLVYIRVRGRWWVKPYFSNPLTTINEDGTWECDITTGGVDSQATAVAAYLVPTDYDPQVDKPLSSIPRHLEELALDKETVKRKPLSRDEIRALLRDKRRKRKGRTVLKGVCYGPFRDNENPDKGIFPLEDAIGEDIVFLSKITPKIRTYGAVETLGEIPRICEKTGIDCYLGAWLGEYETENKKEIDLLLKISRQDLKCLKALIVGNEVLLRKDLSEDDLREYIRVVKKQTDLPVTTAEVWQWWLKHPRLADDVDFLMVHIHPYWEGVPVEEAAEHVVSAWKRIKKAFPGKRVVVGETGWPSDGKQVGKAVPSEENQAKFFKEFVRLAKREGIEYFYFELFDENWKSKAEGRVGAHWGIYNSDGSLKTHLKSMISVKGIKRPPRKVSPVEVSAPLVVYKDAGSPENSFQPSGWMGDVKSIDLNKACETKPHSGETCTRIDYDPRRSSRRGWAGIYWQYPLNNWGEYPGYKLSSAVKISFWARGEKGGEKAEFKVGGISNPTKPHRDSFGPLTTGVLSLTREWKKYAVSLKDRDTSNIIGGFCWAVSRMRNPKGCTIYVDDIVFESSESKED